MHLPCLAHVLKILFGGMEHGTEGELGRTAKHVPASVRVVSSVPSLNSGDAGY